MKIRSVAILGAGAVGSYLLWGLTDKPGGDGQCCGRGYTRRPAAPRRVYDQR